MQQCRSTTVHIQSRPELRLDPPSATVYRGESLFIRCLSSDSDHSFGSKLGYSWTKNNILFQSDVRNELWEDLYPDGSILKITNIQVHTRFMQRCTARTRKCPHWHNRIRIIKNSISIQLFHIFTDISMFTHLISRQNNNVVNLIIVIELFMMIYRCIAVSLVLGEDFLPQIAFNDSINSHWYLYRNRPITPASRRIASVRCRKAFMSMWLISARWNYAAKKGLSVWSGQPVHLVRLHSPNAPDTLWVNLSGFVNSVISGSQHGWYQTFPNVWPAVLLTFIMR